jgi:Heat induced stress protein YflT
MSSSDTRPDQAALTTGRTVVGLFSQRTQAEAAIRELKRSGFTDDLIGVAMHDSPAPVEPAKHSDAEVAEGATVGALTGGVLGGLVGLLGSLLIPGVGPILVGGVLASLVGAGIGATTGGIIGALTGIGVPEHDAMHFDAGLRAGGTLVTVSAKDRTPEALEVLQAHEADLGPSRGERRRANTESYTGPERRLAGV